MMEEELYQCTKCKEWFVDIDIETFKVCVCKVCAQENNS